MSDIVIVYHSGYGHTQRVAQAVSEGAEAAVIAIDADGNLPEGSWEVLAAARLIVFGAPTYMGAPSWQFKKFADASSKVWFVQGWKNKLFAGFTNSGTMNGDKFASIAYFWQLAMQHGGLWVGLGIMPSNKKSSTRDSLNYVGGFGGLMTTSPSDASPGEIPAGDLDTARAFGERLRGALQLLA